MPLFNFDINKFTLSSNQRTDFLIDCNSLTSDDWESLANRAAELVGPFGYYHAIPTGGSKFAKCLSEFSTENDNHLLIVDDVYTTGASIYKAKEWLCLSGIDEKFIKGVVVFDRSGGKCLDWITPLFEMKF